MKSILTLVMICSLLTVINANPNKATIIIESHDHQPIIVELDHQHNNIVRPIHTIENLRPGNHFVEIISVRDPHQSHHYNGNTTLYRGHIMAYAGYATIYHIDCGRLVLVSKNLIRPNYFNNCSCPNHGHCNNSGCSCNSCSGQGGQGHGNGYQWNNGNYMNSPYGYGHNQPNYNGYNQQYKSDYYGWQNDPMNQYNDPYYNNHYMSPQYFDRFMQGLRATNMDGDKVKYLKAQLNDQVLSIEQVQAIVDEVFFESNKVEAAKFLYHKTDDKAQFGSVIDDFSFSSSKRQLTAYISDQK